MALFDQIGDEMKKAMKAKDKIRLEALRGIKKVMLEAKSTKGAGSELSEDEELKIIQKLAKQGRDSADIYKQQDRDDLYNDEMAQVEVFESFLPAKMSNEELEQAVKQIINDTGAESMKDMGKVMGIASKQLAGKADGKDISVKVKELLG